MIRSPIVSAVTILAVWEAVACGTRRDFVQTLACQPGSCWKGPDD
jgi:hypothetical protein